MRFLDASTLLPLKPTDFGYDISEAVSVAVQMPQVWKIDDYTWFMGHELADVFKEAAEMGHQPDIHEARRAWCMIGEPDALTSAEMNELDFINDDGSTVKFMDEYKRLLREGTFCCMFASELI